MIVQNIFHFIISAAASAGKTTGIVTKAPETLDLSQVQAWINGSVWALLSLNLLALGIFIVNALYPQTIRLLLGLKAAAMKLKPKPKVRPAVAPSPQTEAPAGTEEATEVLTSVEEDVEKPQQKADASKAAAPAPSPTPEPAKSTAPTDPAPVVESAAAAPSPSVPPEPELEEVVEEIDLPKMPEPAPVIEFTETTNTEILSNPLPGPNDVTEIITALPPAPSPTPEPEKPAPAAKSPPLPAAAVSVETNSASMTSDSLKSLDETLDAVLAGTQDATEEISIFDPATIDKVLEEEQKQEDNKK